MNDNLVVVAYVKTFFLLLISYWLLLTANAFKEDASNLVDEFLRGQLLAHEQLFMPTERERTHKGERIALPKILSC